MRRDAKVDQNQAEIVDALRQVGASVQCLHAVGGGCPDLLVGFWGRGGRKNVLLEIKTESGHLNARQKEWHSGWKGQVCVVKSICEAVQVVLSER